MKFEKVLLMVLVCLFMSSCQSFKKVSVDSGNRISLSKIETGDKVKILKGDGSVLCLIFYRIEGEALIGQVYRGFDNVSPNGGVESSIALSEISKIEVRKFSFGKTLLIPVGAFVGFFVLYVLTFGGAFS